MRANPFYYGQVLGRVMAPVLRPVISGISVALVLGGCATHPPLGVTCGNVQPLPEPLRLQLGTVALTSPGPPAQVSFDQPAGQIATFGDGATEATARVLNPSGFGGDPGSLAVAGVGGFLIAPVVAVAAGSSSAHQRLAANKSSLCQSNLLAAMKTMAAQERFRDCLVQAAHDTTRRRFLPEPATTPGVPCSGADAVLETQVQQLRLERTGKGDASYALRIEAKMRLLRSTDRTVLYEAPLTWRSDTCLFLDWTRSDSFQKVAQTAYREMAARVVDQLFVATPEGPLLAGTGYKAANVRRAKAAATLTAKRGVLPATDLQPVSYPALNTGTIGVCPTQTPHGIAVQTPSTKDVAAAEAVQDMNWAFDGLYNSLNPMIALPAIAVGLPVGLWKQGVALASGGTERKLQQADTQLYAATRGLHPHEQLAVEVAQTLSAQTAQTVVLMRPPSPGARPESALVQCVARGTPTGSPKGRLVADDSVRLQPDTVLEIHVDNATLEAKSGLNPAMALCVDVQARLLRASDGAEIYSCPVHYRSQERKFSQWAAHDAQLFRQELQACYREVGATVANQLAARHLVLPNHGPASLVAGN